jgi:hypothetical protein
MYHLETAARAPRHRDRHRIDIIIMSVMLRGPGTSDTVTPARAGKCVLVSTCFAPTQATGLGPELASDRARKDSETQARPAARAVTVTVTIAGPGAGNRRSRLGA